MMLAPAPLPVCPVGGAPGRRIWPVEPFYSVVIRTTVAPIVDVENPKKLSYQGFSCHLAAAATQSVTDGLPLSSVPDPSPRTPIPTPMYSNAV